MKLWTMKHGINWDWFALIETHSDGTATVLREGRLHKFKDEQGANVIELYHRAAAHNRYSIRDMVRAEFSEPRTADGVFVNGDWFPFAQPVPRWSFPGLTPQPEELSE